MKQTDELNFEEVMEQLEKIIQDLEKGDLNLDESIKKFEEGMLLSKKCNQFLEVAEKKITKLIKESDRNNK